MARPPKYTSDDEKPVSVTLRIPRDLYDQAQHVVTMRRTTLTELMVEGLQMRLDTPTDPREVLVSQDITVMHELRQMIATEVQAALAVQHVQAPEPTATRQTAKKRTAQHYSNAPQEPTVDAATGYVYASEPEPGHSLVTEPAPSRKGGKPPSAARLQILALLPQHPEGLTAEELRVHIQAQRPLGDTLAGMRRSGTVRTTGQGKQLRYFSAAQGA